MISDKRQVCLITHMANGHRHLVNSVKVNTLNCKSMQIFG